MARDGWRGGRPALILVLACALASPAAASADPLERWAPEIARSSARFGIPKAWIRAVMRAESGGDTLLRGQPIMSRAGAMGLMQLMPATWRAMRAWLKLGADPYDPADNILAGTAYLRLMYDRFGYPGLFAAYNAGPARYASSLNGSRPLPAETRAYVAAVAVKPSPVTRTFPPVGLFAVPPAPSSAPLDRPAQPPSLFVALGGSLTR